MTNQAVCLVRYHDGTAKTNWGGRATSLALAGLIAQTPDRTLGSLVNGSVLVHGFSSPPPRERAKNLTRRVVRRAAKAANRSADIWPLATGPMFDRAPVEGQRSNPELRSIVSTFEAADEVWVNGEGDPILSTRPSLYRMLVLMHLAHDLGKPVRLVNSILSEPVTGPADPHVVAAVGRAIDLCTEVVYRDPESLRLHGSLYPGPARWAPDALFSWASEGGHEGTAFGPCAEGLELGVQHLLQDAAPIVAISGSSALRLMGNPEGAKTQLRQLVDGIYRAGMAPVIVETCGGDSWMPDVCPDVPAVAASVPLASGLTVLSAARCLVSGRYHPSILAMDVGTPCVFMTANSHKTTSLQELVGETPRTYPFLGHGADIDEVVDAVGRAARRDRQLVRAKAVAAGRSISYLEPIER